MRPDTFTTSPEERFDFETETGRLAARQEQGELAQRYAEIAAEREEKLAAFDLQIEATQQARARMLSSQGYDARLAAYANQLYLHWRLEEGHKAKPKPRLVTVTGYEFQARKQRDRKVWLDDETLVNGMIDQLFPEEAVDRLAPRGPRKTVKKALEEALLEDGHTLRYVDPETGEVYEVTFEMRVVSTEPPPVPYTYEVHTPDGTTFKHNPLDDPEPGEEGDEDDEAADEEA